MDLTIKQIGQKYLAQRPKRINSFLLNLLGIQVIRIILDKIFYFIRYAFDFKVYSKEVLTAAETLSKEGILVIENFLSPPNYVNLKFEYQKNFEKIDTSKVHRRKAGPIILEDIRVFSDSNSQLPYTYKLIRKNKFIRDVIEVASRRKIRLEPTCVLQNAYQSEVNDTNIEIHGHTEFDDETIWHQDHVFSVFKAWYYIEDVTAENGAFEYLKYSFNISPARLKYEYKRGIYQQHVLENKSNLVPTDFIDRGRIIPNDQTKKDMGAYPTIGAGKANTLIIANTLGYHRRGNFAKGASRKLIHLDFRKIDSVLNSIPYLNKLINIDHYSSQYKN